MSIDLLPGRRFGLVAAAALLALAAACSSNPGEPKASVSRPPGQEVVALSGSGALDGHPWQVEVVRQAGQLCLQGLIDSKIMSTECGFQTDRDKIPLNFEVVGNDKVLFVIGAADPVITSLALVPEAGRVESDVPLYRSSDQPAGLFGFAAKPTTVQDLIGRDAGGKQIASGGAKIRSSVEGDEDVTPR